MIYVGQHQTEDLNDGYMGSGIRIVRAIEKYGIENFEKTILFECKSKAEMNAKEVEIVNEDFISRDDVYNVIVGGENGSWEKIHQQGLHHLGGVNAMKKLSKNGLTPFTKFLKSLTPEEYVQYWKDHSTIKSFRCDWTGRKHNEETKKKIGLANSISQAGSRNSQYGKMWICNDLTRESRSILKTDPIPDGWRRGRICKK